MDRANLLELVHREIAAAHSFGEGAGGSGHMASIGLGSVDIVSTTDVERGGRRCAEVVYAYSIDRESEFGGESYRHTKRLVVAEDGEVLQRSSLETKVYDILTGEERAGMFDLPE